MIRTGIFGGSFHPLHEGHIALADYFYRSGLLDEVWFVVSPQNPMKKAEDLSDAQQRLEAARLKLAPYPQFQVCDIELELPRPSYMSNTLRALGERYPERVFSLIIGGDNLDCFANWHESQWIRDRFDVLVYPRPGCANRVPDGWTRVRMFDDAPQMAISSTDIREHRVMHGQPSGVKIKGFKASMARFILRLAGWQTEECYPQLRRCVLAIAPHTSNWDFVMCKLFGWAEKREGYFLIKKDWFFFPLNLFFKAVGGVPVDRSRRDAHMSEQLASTLRGLDGCIAVTPEGTRKAVKRWKRGFYQIALQAEVPILLMKLDYGKKLISTDCLFYPSGDEKADMAIIRSCFRGVQPRYPDLFVCEE